MRWSALLLVLLAACDPPPPSVATARVAVAAETPRTPGAVVIPPAPKLLGLQVRALPPATLQSLGVDYGLMVTRVRPPANRSRIMPGDVILAVNQTAIRSIEDFDRLMADQSASGIVSLLVRRADEDLYIALETGSGAARGPAEAFKTRRPATDTPLRT